jgi:tetratricopeptide (TPR) repeat protein
MSAPYISPRVCLFRVSCCKRSCIRFGGSHRRKQAGFEAYKALQVGDAAFAVTAYGKAIESRALEPEVLANALLNRGLAYQRLNEHEFAIDDYTAAMRIDAMSGKLRALALYNRGLVLPAAAARRAGD